MRRVAPRATWRDLVLPEAVERRLRAAADEARARARLRAAWSFDPVPGRRPCTVLLFSGPSGTGKSLSAEVLAAELNHDLHVVDLAAVVSKYIGETEKNLGRILDEASRRGTILLFDEADALFGRRTRVRSARDRYANMEVNYLLQRLEGHPGIAILATNRRRAIDPAFLRRLHAHIEFPMPGPAERERIWHRLFPADTPGRATLDFKRLASVPLTGAGIRSAALHAALLAASEGTPVSMDLALHAVRCELRKPAC